MSVSQQLIDGTLTYPCRIIDRAKSRAKEVAETFARKNLVEAVDSGNTSGVKQKSSVVQRKTQSKSGGLVKHSSKTEYQGMRSLFRQTKRRLRNVAARVVDYIKKCT